MGHLSLTHSRLRFCTLANLLGALQALGYRLNSINSTHTHSRTERVS